MKQYSGQGGAKSTTRAKFFRLGMLTFEKQTPKSNFTGFRGGYLCSLEFYRTAIFEQISSFIARPMVWLVGIRALGDSRRWHSSLLTSSTQSPHIDKHQKAEIISSHRYVKEVTRPSYLFLSSLSSAGCFCMRVHTFHTIINFHQCYGDVAGQCY